MRKLVVLFALLGIAGAASAAVLTHGSLGIGHGITVPSQDSNPCNGVLSLNYDGTAENGYCWQYGGVVAPYYGAFAECFSWPNNDVCGIELMLSGVGYPCFGCDLYVWDDAHGVPGNVLSLTSGINPCPVATWPSISTHDFAIGGAGVNGNFWVGYWVNASSAVCPYFVAADLDGFGGCPYTNIAPGIGYPTGWQNVSVVWGATQALGIGAWGGCAPGARCGDDPGPCCEPDGSCQWVYPCDGYWSPTGTCDPNPCEPTPVQTTSWGQIKHLYK